MIDTLLILIGVPILFLLVVLGVVGIWFTAKTHGRTWPFQGWLLVLGTYLLLFAAPGEDGFASMKGQFHVWFLWIPLAITVLWFSFLLIQRHNDDGY